MTESLATPMPRLDAAPVLQDGLPEDAMAHALPGTRPLAPGDWLRRDEAYAGQMALRDRLVAERRDEVLGVLPEGCEAAAELLDMVLSELGVEGEAWQRPDGVRVAIDRADPLATLGRLCQEDFALMLPGDPEHWLAGGVVCFPSRWRLAEKLGRPLTGIHRPVAVYDDTLARRVQRLFDGVRAGQPIHRWNRLPYWDSALFNPQSEPADGRAYEPRQGGERPYLRAERQVILRLPRTGAVVFSIHTWLVRNPEAAAS